MLATVNFQHNIPEETGLNMQQIELFSVVPRWSQNRNLCNTVYCILLLLHANMLLVRSAVLNSSEKLFCSGIFVMHVVEPTFGGNPTLFSQYMSILIEVMKRKDRGWNQ